MAHKLTDEEKGGVIVLKAFLVALGMFGGCLAYDCSVKASIGWTIVAWVVGLFAACIGCAIREYWEQEVSRP